MAVSILFFCMALGTGSSLRNLRRTSAAARRTDGEKSKNEPQASYRLKKFDHLKRKNLEEFDFDVRKSLAPRKSAENHEKRKTNPKFVL